MNVFTNYSTRASLAAILTAGIFTLGCGGGHWDTATVDPVVIMPVVTDTNPNDNEQNVPLDQIVTVNFNKAMNSATIDGTSFTLTAPDDTPVLGTVTYTALGSVATFTPNELLEPDTLYTATITTDVEDIDGNALASNQEWSFETVAAILPLVTDTNPNDDEQNVPLDRIVTVNFNKAMNSATINDTTFTLTGPDATPVLGTVVYTALGNVATFTPDELLAPETLYTATITTGVEDMDGNALASNQEWSFETVAAIVLPEVTDTNPNADEQDVPLNRIVTATFSKAMNPATISDTTFTLTAAPDDTPVLGTVAYTALGNFVTFTPDELLAANTLYTATITTDVQDTDGNALAVNQEWSFETALDVEIIPPVVDATNPVEFATDVCTTKTVKATFAEAMNPLTLVSPALSFTLKESVSQMNVAGEVTLDQAGTLATFTPTLPFTEGTEYTATITTDAEDLAGNGLAVNEEWVFTAGAVVCQEPVVLGAAEPFGVLSNTGVTLGGGPLSTTGFRVIGDVGIFPAGACVGCDNTTVDGVISIGNVVASDAMDAAEDMYNDAIGRSVDVCTLIDSGSLATNPSATCGGGADGIFTPGLYWSASSISIPAGGTITLDAQNDPDAVFIFQSESTIDTIGGNTHVILANQAQAKNVFWVAKSSATIGGTTSDFAGTVIALVAVTVNTGTEMAGRAFARTAEVTVQDGALITVPAP